MKKWSILFGLVVISYEYYVDANYLSIFKHKNSSFFKRYSKVIEFSIRNHRWIIEF